MLYSSARQGVGRIIGATFATLAIVAAMVVVPGWVSPASAADPVATKTTLALNADGTGTVEVTADGITPAGYVDLWIDSTWQKAYELSDGRTTVDLGTQPHGDHQIYVRYRADATTKASDAITTWTAPGTIQYPTKTTLSLNADGTGTVEVTSEGTAPTNYVDLWINSTWQKAYALTGGKAAVNLGTQPHGEHQIYVRYRANSTTKTSEALTTWVAPGTVAVPTTTTLALNADGTGTVQVTAEGGITPTSYVDLWIDDVWQKAYTLTAGKAAVNLGTQPLGDHRIVARYRANSMTKASEASATWTAPGTVQQPTKTTLALNADGTGTVQVTAEGGATPTNVVDLWVGSTWQKAYALTGGKATINLGTQAQGDHQIYVRYRGTSTTKPSDALVTWTAPGTIQQPTKTTLTLNADGTGTVQVTAEGGATATTLVDLWIDSTWQKGYVLSGGKATVNLGTQPQGDHQIYVRYRGTSTTKPSDALVTWTAPGTIQHPTKTTLAVNADGTGTVQVTAEGGATPTNVVDLWVGSTWQKAYALTAGKATINLGTQAQGDHQIYVRYRGTSTTKPSDAVTTWTAPGTIQQPTKTTLTLNADGTGTVQVTAEGGVTPTNLVDLWVDSTWQKAYALTGGKAAVDLGTQSQGDHRITVRYRANSTTQGSQTSVVWTAPGTIQHPTTTTLTLNKDDGTGTIKVTSEGAAPTNYVDMWIDNIWQKAYALTNGEATFDLDPLPGGDHQVVVRYRPNSTTQASSDNEPWSVTTADQVPTTATLNVLPDGTGTIKVTVEGGATPTNKVDLWVDEQYKGFHTLTDGKATFDLGSRPGGDLPVTVRYRPSATEQASKASAVWSVDTAPKPDPSECGASILKANGEAWTCSFADDFSGTALDRTKWAPQEMFGTGDNELACYVDSPDNVSVSGGELNLTLLKGEPKPCAGHNNVVTPYTSGMVTTFHKWSQQYGRFEARVKTTATTAPGLHEAFWLWPDTRYPEGQETWPTNGEIDIAETFSNHAGLVVPFLHSSLDFLGSILTGKDANTTWSCRAARGEYNTYTLEWSAERLEIFVNGNSCLVNTSGNAAFNKRYVMAFTQALGSQDNDQTPDTPVPATMSIDYVRAWS